MTMKRFGSGFTIQPVDEKEKRRAERRAAIQEGLDAVARGETIPAEEIEAWIESLGTPNELPPPEPRRR